MDETTTSITRSDQPTSDQNTECAVDWRALFDDKQQQFMRETLRTSEYYRLTDRIVRKLFDMGHRDDGRPPCQPNRCDFCRWMIDAKMLMEQPINRGSICVCGYSLGVHMACESGGSWSDFPGCCTSFQPAPNGPRERATTSVPGSPATKPQSNEEAVVP